MASIPFFFLADAFAAADPYPAIEGVTRGLSSADLTTHVVTMPAAVNAGDLLLVMWANDDTATVSAPDFTSVISATSGTASIAVLAKVAAGTEGGTTVDFTTTVGERAGFITYCISGWGGTIASHVVATSATNSGTGATLDCPSLTSGFGAVPTLWFAVCSKSGLGTPDAYPSGYSFDPDSTFYSGTDFGAANSTIMSAWKKATAASEDPGSFGYTSTAAAVSKTVAVRGIA